METVVKAEDLVKHYGAGGNITKAVDHVNLEIKRGKFTAIMGRSGSGKSTLLKLICGILKPYKGTVKICGSIAPLIELGAGFDGELTARENVLLNGTLMGYSESFMKEHFEEIIDFAQLWEFLDMPTPEAEVRMIAPIKEAVEQWEPRATVKDVFFTRSRDGSGKLVAHVEIEINDLGERVKGR